MKLNAPVEIHVFSLHIVNKLLQSKRAHCGSCETGSKFMISTRTCIRIICLPRERVRYYNPSITFNRLTFDINFLRVYWS